MQYYKLPNGQIYLLNKQTGVVSQVSSIPSGAAVINWNSTTSLPPELTNSAATNQSVNAAIDQHVNDIIGAVVASGKTINPNITADDLANLDPATFLSQAEATIAPEYQQKFQVAKDSLTRKLSEIGYDLNTKKSDLERKQQEDQLTSAEDFAGRGLAFSGNRNEYDRKSTEQLTRDEEAARTLAFRNAQDALSTTEQQIGTSNVQSVGIPSIDGRTLSLSSTPLTGSLNNEKQYYKESLAKELESQARARQAYATRNLSFA